MAVTVTNSKLLAMDSAISVVENAATATGANTAEAFTITLTKPGSHGCVIINNASSSDGTLTWSIAKGTGFGASVAKTGSVAQGVRQVITLDDARYKNASAAIVLTLTPATGKILLTDHAATVEVIELPFQ